MSYLGCNFSHSAADCFSRVAAWVRGLRASAARETEAPLASIADRSWPARSSVWRGRGRGQRGVFGGQQGLSGPPQHRPGLRREPRPSRPLPPSLDHWGLVYAKPRLPNHARLGVALKRIAAPQETKGAATTAVLCGELTTTSIAPTPRLSGTGECIYLCLNRTANTQQSVGTNQHNRVPVNRDRSPRTPSASNTRDPCISNVRPGLDRCE